MRSATLLFNMLLVATIVQTGCTSTGMQRSEEATTTMQTMDDDIKMAVVQLDATGASLNELMKPGQSDVKKAFELYSDNASKIVKMQESFAKHADEMKARGKDYFSEWQKEGKDYKNPQIQALSEQRRAELETIYARIAESSIGVKDAFKKYATDVEEIQTFLSNDLTEKGFEAIHPISAKTVSDGNDLKYMIKDVQLAIENARTEMSQSGM
jgi:hypothetical protein